MEPITLLLADDHGLIRQGLRQELEHADDLVVLAEAGSVREAVAQARQHRPQVAIVDAQLPAALARRSSS